MADTGQSAIETSDCQGSLMMEVAADSTPALAEAAEQCEVSSTTDGLEMPAPNISSGNNPPGGGNGNKKQTTATPAPAQVTARAGGVGKIHQFRAPQQCVQPKKKLWNKRQKCHHHLKYHAQQLQQQQLHHQQQQQQQQTTASKADLENIQNIKNQIGHHRLPVGVCAACGIEAGNNNSQQVKNPSKQQVYKKMLAHRSCNGGGGGCSACNGVGSSVNGAPPLAHHSVFCSRSKFFLPDKRPRKEVIIPPTKFLLGGNISDPLNLNSLQNEANSSNNNTPATTPRQSPITTPPKVEVIIPPNIHDPLHLLDPVDTMEYEKQLTSPMKRKSKSSKSKHRNRKKKTKRRRFESVNSTIDDSDMDRGVTINSTLSTDLGSTSVASDCCLSDAQHNSSAEFDDGTGASNEKSRSRESADEKALDGSAGVCAGARVDKPTASSGGGCVSGKAVLPSLQQPATGGGGGGGGGGGAEVDANKSHSNSSATATSDRESVKKDLRLDLSGLAEAQQSHAFNHHHPYQHNNSSMGGSGSGSIGSCGGGRKRKVSEGACSAKNKFRRMDSMDKIVSPVVPQPGAWKRPPRLVPTGARKASRHRSTSVSETELLSPADDSRTITDTDSIRADTPDNDSVSKHMDTASVGSPLSTASINTVDNASINEKLSAAAVQSDEVVVPITTGDSKIMPKFRSEGAKYQYGNYDRYTGYRHLNEFMDVRLQVFQRNAELFRGKDILDIGCNVGHMTITVARNLAPKSILGIDIDKNLIARARKNLSMHVRIPKVKTEQPLAKKDKEGLKDEPQETEESQVSQQLMLKQQHTAMKNQNNHRRRKNNQHQQQQQQQQHQHQQHPHHHHHQQQTQQQQQHHNFHHHHHYHAHHHFHHGFLAHPHHGVEPQNLFPVSFPLTYGGIPEVNRQLQSEVEPSSSSFAGAAEFPKNVFFRQTNYVLKDEALLNNDTQQYDLIVCLSVTKWIHLNFGDNGLKMAFKRMFNQLRPGGKLILEAQNWASYKKKKNLTETIYNNYRNIEFFPNKFHEYLLSNEVGFSHCYTLGVPRHMSKGFCRPIQLYAKGDFTPNHVRWSDAYHPQTPYEAYRGIYATMPRQPHPVPSAYDTPCGGNSGSYSCRQTPMHQPTSQYYNPLETDSYLPSYDIEVLNQLYVFASPLYQTVWSPPASMRNSSSHTPLFGSIREIENEEGGSGGGGSSFHRHVYPPNDEITSPNANGAFNSIRDADTDDSQTQSVVRHVYANCESSSSPHVNDSETQDGYEQNGGCGDSNES